MRRTTGDPADDDLIRRQARRAGCLGLALVAAVLLGLAIWFFAHLLSTW